MELLFNGCPYLGIGKLLVLFKSNPLLFLPITSYYSHVSKWRVTGRGTQGVNRKLFCAKRMGERGGKRQIPLGYNTVTFILILIVAKEKIYNHQFALLP